MSIFDSTARFPNENEIEELLKSGAERKNLDFSGFNISSELGLFISDWIISSTLFSFENVNLNNCIIPLRGFEAIVNTAVDFKELSAFSACNNNLTREAGFAISKLLGARGKLKWLDLSDNKFSDVGIASIAGTFTTDLSDLDSNSTVSMLTLVELNLSGNSCGDMGVLALCRGLTQFSRHTAVLGRIPALKILKLDRNNIGDKGALCLAQLLVTCSTLPPSGSTAGSRRPRELAVGFQLHQLSLNDNQIGSRGVVAFLAGPVDSQACGNISLQALHLARCKASLAVYEALVSHLQSSTSNLSQIDVSLSREDAVAVLAEQVDKPGNHYWTTMFRKLSEAVVSCRHKAVQIQLGLLPDVILSACGQAKESGAMDRFYDLVGAIDAMCSIRSTLQLSKEFLKKVSELWIVSGKKLNIVDSPQVNRNAVHFNDAVEASLTPSQQLEQQQFEYSRLRNEHTNAFQSLASEIQRLVQDRSSPTMPLVATALPPPRPPPPPPSPSLLSASTANAALMPTKSKSKIESSTIAELIQAAVTAAVDNAKRHWDKSILEAQAEANDKNLMLQTKVELLQERVLALESQSIVSESQSRMGLLEQRIVKLEAAVLAATFREHELHQTANNLPHVPPQVAPGRQRTDIEDAMQERLSMLEHAVEQEHESSLQVLDALLLQQKQFKQMQMMSLGYSPNAQATSLGYSYHVEGDLPPSMPVHANEDFGRNIRNLRNEKEPLSAHKTIQPLSASKGAEKKAVLRRSGSPGSFRRSK